jgi:AcrR family transcriptional regulator
MPRRRGLTEEDIFAAALKLVDEDGLDALSMRRLGASLGVDPMAVYRHIAGKEELLHGLVKRIFTEMPAPADKGPWTRRVRQWARAYRSVAQAHPNLVLRIVSDPEAVGVAAVHANETLYKALELSGLSPVEVVRAAGLIVDFVNGWVLATTAGDIRARASEAFQAALDAQPDEAVAVQRRVLQHARRGVDGDSFGFGIDVILGGLQQRIDQKQRRKGAR